jgi:hypothetical protein
MNENGNLSWCHFYISSDENEFTAGNDHIINKMLLAL